MFLDVVYVKGIIDISLGRRAAWGHVVRAPAQPREDQSTELVR